MRILCAAASFLLGCSVAFADLRPWEDYEVSDEVWQVSTIRVDANMDDAYLEGLANTWVKGNEVAKKLGQIEDYFIYRSDLPQSGDFNLLLVIKFKSSEDLAPNKAEYERFMKEFTQQAADESTEFAQKNYPAMREITGQYNFRRIDLKK